MSAGSKVLYLGAASGTTVSHVSDVVGPVSVINFFNSLTHTRLVLCMLWSSLIDLGEILLTLPRSVLTLSPSLRMPAIRTRFLFIFNAIIIF